MSSQLSSFPELQSWTNRVTHFNVILSKLSHIAGDCRETFRAFELCKFVVCMHPLLIWISRVCCACAALEIESQVPVYLTRQGNKATTIISGNWLKISKQFEKNWKLINERCILAKLVGVQKGYRSWNRAELVSMTRWVWCVTFGVEPTTELCCWIVAYKKPHSLIVQYFPRGTF